MRKVLTIGFLLAAACTDQPFTVDIALRVVSIQPGGGARDIARESSIAIVFSEELVAETAQKARLTAGGADVPATITYDKAASTLTLTPAGKLDYSRSYTVVIPNEIARVRDGSRMPFEVKSEFRTADPPPLQLVTSAPGNGASGVSREQILKLTFSEPVKCATLSAGVTVVESPDPHWRSAGPARTIAGAWTCAEPTGPDQLEGTACDAQTDLCTVTFTPAATNFRFGWSSHLAVTLKGGSRADGAVESFRATESGGQIPQTFTLGSHVQDPPQMLLASSSPAHASQGSPRDVMISIKFTEPVDCDTASDLITFQRTLDPLPVRRNEGKTAIASPGGSLRCMEARSAEATCDSDRFSCEVLYFLPATGETLYDWSSLIEVRARGDVYTPDQPVPTSRAVESIRATSHSGALPANSFVAFRVEDPPSFALAAASPGAGARGVARDLDGGPIALVFSEPPDCDSVTRNALIEELRADGSTAAVAGTWTCPALPAPDEYGCGTDGALCLITFAPTLGADGKAFAYSSTVRVSVAGGAYTPDDDSITDLVFAQSTRATTRGGQLSAPAAIRFHVEDPPALLIAAMNPGAGASGVPVGSTIRFFFSGPPGLPVSEWGGVDCASFEGALSVTETADVELGGATRAVTGTLACADGGTDATFTPAGALGLSSTVQVHVEGGPRPGAAETTFATGAGGQLPRDFDARFDVEDPPLLSIVRASPSPQGTSVTCAGSEVRIQLSAAVDKTTVRYGDGVSDTFAIHDQTNGGVLVAGALAFADADSDGRDETIVFTPSLSCTAGFAYSANLRVSLEGGLAGVRAAVSTSAGGFLPTDMAWTFRVQDVPTLTTLAMFPSATPAGTVSGVDTSTDTTVQVVFNQPVSRASITRASFFVNVGVPSGALPDSASDASTDWADFSFAAGDTKVTLTPPAGALRFNTPYTVTLTQRICSALSTPTNEGGCLLVPITWSFRTKGPPELLVASTDPQNGEVNVPRGKIVEIAFSNSVNAATLTTDPADGDSEVPNIFLNPGITSDFARRLPATLSFVDPPLNLTVRLQTTDQLSDDQRYTVTVTTDLRDVFGGRLSNDYTFRFRTPISGLIDFITPDGPTDRLSKVVIKFSKPVAPSTLNTGTLFVSYVDDLGRTRILPSTLALFDGEGGTDRAELTPDYHSISRCDPSQEPRIPYQTTFSVNILPMVRALDGMLNADYVPHTFTTGADPRISAVRTRLARPSGEVVRELLAGARSEVPVGSVVEVEFAEDMQTGGGNAHAVDRAGNIRLLRDGAPETAILTVIGPRRVTLAPALVRGSTYTVIVEGRSAGDLAEIRTTAGSWLEGNARFTFTVSPGTYGKPSPPPGFSPTTGTVMSMQFDRPIDPATVDDATFLMLVGAVPVPGLISVAPDRRSVTFFPVPRWAGGEAPVLRVTSGVTDEFGTPLCNLASAGPACSGAALDTAYSGVSGSSQNSPTVTISTPAVPAPLGDSTFLATVNTGGHLIPSTVKNGAGFVQLIKDPAGLRQDVPATVTYLPAATTGVGASIQVVPSVALERGATYRLQVGVVGQSTSNLASVTLAPANVTSRDYTVDTSSPALLSVAATKPAVALPSGSLLALDTQLVATFNRGMRASTLVGADGKCVTPNVTLTTGITPVTLLCKLDATATILTLTPSPALSRNVTNYTLAFAATVLDAAGNSLIVASRTFSTETSRLRVASISPAPGATSVSPGAAVTVRFNRPVGPATLLSPTSTAGGNFKLSYTNPCTAAAAPLMGCVAIGDSGSEVTFTARPAMHGRLVHTVDLDGVSDLALTDALDKAGALVPSTFTVADAAPAGLCSRILAGPQRVEVAFNEPVDTATVNASTFFVYQVSTGAAAAGALTFTATGGGACTTDCTRVIFTPSAPLTSGQSYGVLATVGVQDQGSAASLLEDFHGTFIAP